MVSTGEKKKETSVSSCISFIKSKIEVSKCNQINYALKEAVKSKKFQENLRDSVFNENLIIVLVFAGTTVKAANKPSAASAQ